MKNDEGYIEARKLLKDRYGQGYKMAAAHVQALTEGSPIKNEDRDALVKFSIQLTSCTNTLKEIGCLSKLDHPENLNKIIGRLPFGMILQRCDAVDRIVENEGRDVTIKDVTSFVTARARAATHSVFGRVVNEGRGKQVNKKPKHQSGLRASGFATRGDQPVHNSQESNKPTDLKCPSCSANHWLSCCERFRRLSLEERKALVKDKRLCLNCLNVGHFVRACPKRSFCKVEGCSGKHSTFLHPKKPPTHRHSNDEQPPKPVNEEEHEPKPNSANNGYVKKSSKSCDSRSSSVTALAIVPVRVKAKGVSDVVETYAFLDNGSNTSFCTEGLSKKLNHQGTKTKLSLTTMLGEGTPVKCSFTSTAGHI